jgi:lysophospholipase L1-like esterase
MPSPSKSTVRHVRPQLEALEDRCLLDAGPTTVAAPGVSMAFWGEAMLAQQPLGNPNVVFLGDSILWAYSNSLGAPFWNASIAPDGAANLAVPGQTTQNVLFQLETGALQGAHPQAVVLMIGGNNLLAGNTPDQTAAGVMADVQAIHAQDPGAQVLVLAIPPLGSSPQDPIRAEVAQTNALIAQQVAGLPYAQYLDTTSSFVQPDGTVPTSLLYDGIHPTALGYWLMTNSLAGPLAQDVGAVGTTAAPTAGIAATE